jgi:hypothetical protein
MVTWFKYVDNVNVRFLTSDVMKHMSERRRSRANYECIRHLNLVIEESLSACFLIDRIQLLDELSLSLIRECIHGTPLNIGLRIACRECR